MTSKVLAQYPWPENADQYTGAYLAGAVFTDSGYVFGIGGCANLKLRQDFAKYAPVYAYEFGHRAGPGLTREHGAYEWGAGHAAERLAHEKCSEVRTDSPQLRQRADHPFRFIRGRVLLENRVALQLYALDQLQDEIEFDRADVRSAPSLLEEWDRRSAGVRSSVARGDRAAKPCIP